jgi:hypothetical protein
MAPNLIRFMPLFNLGNKKLGASAQTMLWHIVMHTWNFGLIWWTWVINLWSLLYTMYHLQYVFLAQIHDTHHKKMQSALFLTAIFASPILSWAFPFFQPFMPLIHTCSR